MGSAAKWRVSAPVLLFELLSTCVGFLVSTVGVAALGRMDGVRVYTAKALRTGLALRKCQKDQCLLLVLTLSLSQPKLSHHKLHPL